MRNSFHSCIVCLAPLAYSIVVRRSPERAASGRRLAAGALAFYPSLHGARPSRPASWLFVLTRRRGANAAHTQTRRPTH
eukprot:scaffold43179_cov57-Phaeocystis_antarctica.AAC.1